MSPAPSPGSRWATFQRDLAMTLVSGNLLLVLIEGGAQTPAEMAERCAALGLGVLTYYLALKTRVDRYLAKAHPPKDSN